MRANIVGFEQEEITQLALESEVPTLCVRSRKLALELVVAWQRENDRQELVAVECTAKTRKARKERRPSHLVVHISAIP